MSKKRRGICLGYNKLAYMTKVVGNKVVKLEAVWDIREEGGSERGGQSLVSLLMRTSWHA